MVMEGDLTNYSETDANLSDAIANGMFVVIQSAASRIIDEWAAALKLNSQNKMPNLAFNQQEKDQLGACYGITMRFPSHEDEDLNETGDDVD